MRFPKEDGMLPSKVLYERSEEFRRVRLPSEDGMNLEKLQPHIKIVVRDPRFPIEAGSLPEKLVSVRFIISRVLLH